MSVAISEALWAARLKGSHAEINTEHRPKTEDEAYALQADVIGRFNSQAIGWKVGGTSHKVQETLGLKEPMFAPLLAGFSHQSPARVPLFTGHGPCVELEFVLRLGQDLPAREKPYSRDEAADAVEAVCAGLEIVGSRLPGGLKAANGLMFIADCGVNVAFVCGEPVTGWRDLNLATHEARLSLNGQTAALGTGGEVLGHPLEVLAWLATRRSRMGQGLKTGDLVSTGTCTGIVPVNPGDEAIGDFGSLGRVRAMLVD